MAYNLQLVTKANTTDVILDPTPNTLKVSVANVKGKFFPISLDKKGNYSNLTLWKQYLLAFHWP